MVISIAFAAVVIAIAAWMMRGDPRMSEASASKPGAQSARAEYAQQVRDNAPVRAQLQQKYPDVYRDLASQTRRDLGHCVVTEIMPGLLRATCL